jgi:hypothetical protein
VAEVLYYAIPAFVLLLLMELLSFKYLRDDDLVGYGRDTRTSLTMLQLSISLIYQFWIHTERVKKLPAPIEFFLTHLRTTGFTTAPTRSTSTATTTAP